MSGLELHVSARVSWLAANSDACAAGATAIEPPHLLLGVLRVADGMSGKEVASLELGANDLASLAFSVSAARKALDLDEHALTSVRRRLQHQVRGANSHRTGDIVLHRSPATRTLFEAAAQGAVAAGDASLTVVHLVNTLIAHGLVQAAIEGAALPDVSASAVARDNREEHRPEAARDVDAAPLGRDLTALAREGRLRPVVGRDSETKQLARRLQRTTKRNALLIGDAGVGKTAVVEGLAQFCASDEVPESLGNLRFLEISVGDLMAGTRYRGDLEQRVQDMVSKLEDDPDLVAFIDEVHLIVARQGEDAPTIANLLKPVLDGDHVRCIAATTTDEYERHVKQDPAFARRFGRPIIVQEPSRDVTRLILLEWQGRIESVHPGLTISDDAIDAAVDLAIAHITGRRLPDKAIDLLDDAATFALLPTIHQSGAGPLKSGLTLGREQIEAVLREQHGIDVAMLGADGPRLRETLDQELVGQDVAISRVVSALGGARRAEGADRPLAVLLFTGPTGVGKTFTAELIAEAVFGSSSRLCRLNMNEYAERHEIGRLTGAPPGFVGHERPGALFAFAEGQPEGVILLDEIEKAHEDVREYFLQVFDSGEAMDSRGRRVSFAPYVFVMTSNVLTEPPHPLGFGKSASDQSSEPLLSEESVRQELAKGLTPEFVGRVDAVVLFSALAPQALDELLVRYSHRAIDELRRRDGVELVIDEAALAVLCGLVRDQAEGARGVRHLVDREIVEATRTFLASADVCASDRSMVRISGASGALRMTT